MKKEKTSSNKNFSRRKMPKFLSIRTYIPSFKNMQERSKSSLLCGFYKTFEKMKKFYLKMTQSFRRIFHPQPILTNDLIRFSQTAQSDSRKQPN